MFSLDGKVCVRDTVSVKLPEKTVEDGGCPHAILTDSGIYVPERVRSSLVAAEKLGRELGGVLLSKGAGNVLREARAEMEDIH